MLPIDEFLSLLEEKMTLRDATKKFALTRREGIINKWALFDNALVQYDELGNDGRRYKPDALDDLEDFSLLFEADELAEMEKFYRTLLSVPRSATAP